MHFINISQNDDENFYIRKCDCLPKFVMLGMWMDLKKYH